ncbi:DODA-type extradiol aromatic ring-opening family dioxygenase [Aliagarivorans marinus]|uniref:DODA-type extradiol aromatic ring-opening family dioxygenase n=1 Tax=Aliagarivorans marinus TaxID=561965 RepID=UPI0003FBDA5B|nr:class III extradiol ring-cleavage dioxygenase [Aliagarivorans marinus]
MDTPRFPALFISHGSPMMAVDNSATAQFLMNLGSSLPRPKAIVVFSAHLDRSEQVVITASPRPELIYDFYGFPDALYDIRYPAPGEPVLAQQVSEQLQQAGFITLLDQRLGWDHGVWIPLKLMYPHADIPIVQVSVNSQLDAEHHYRLGQALAALREQQILLVGSGGITHNLRAFFSPEPAQEKGAKALAFNEWVYQQLTDNQRSALLDYREQAPELAYNHPSEEHFLPLLSVLGASEGAAERIHHAMEGEVLSLDAYSFAA